CDLRSDFVKDRALIFQVRDETMSFERMTEIQERKRSPEACLACGETGRLRCSECRLAVYCTKRCEKEHRPQHRIFCEPVQTRPAPQEAKGRIMLRLHEPWDLNALTRILAQMPLPHPDHDNFLQILNQFLHRHPQLTVAD